MNRIITLLYIAIISVVAGARVSAREVTLTVVDGDNGEPLAFSSVWVKPAEMGAMTDADGVCHFSLPTGKYTFGATFVGYTPADTTVTIGGDVSLRLSLAPQSRQLREVTVTARETAGAASVSRIDRDAMNHLQPSSFTDLLELLPGNISKDPDMSRVNTLDLRSTGTLTATGAASVNDDYAIATLGTQFVVDGSPVTTDATLQSVPGADASDAGSRRVTTNRGVDMRTISTDAIESVEVVRGIPSAEYGNLTGGVVNIKRIRKTTPLTMRFKVDGFSKLVAAGKGFSIGGENVLNANIDYLDSRTDPRSNRENYKRVTGVVAPTLHFRLSDESRVVWSPAIEYTGTWDNADTDPDLNAFKIDEYSSRNHRVAITSDLRFNLPSQWMVENVVINASASYADELLERRKQVTPQSAAIAPTSYEVGEHEGVYLPGMYLADYRVEGRPFTATIKAKAAGTAASGLMVNTYKAGAEWNFEKNYGRGQVYDLLRPISASWTTRPRAFSDIPSLQVLSAFAEDDIRVPVGGNRLQVQAGVRALTLPALDSRYYLSGRLYMDPRVNVLWEFPTIDAGKPLRFNVAGGWGLNTRMPTLDYLFPQCHYTDIVQLNYYDVANPAENSLVSLRTYLQDATNYNLQAARNAKWEVRAGAAWGNNRLTVTYFRENMKNGYRYSPVYDAYDYRKYDASAIEQPVTSRPVLETLPWTDARILDGYSRVTNGSRIAKQGIEYTLSTERWQPLRTALTINGAWLRTEYSNSQMLFNTVGDVVGSQSVSDLYVGLYDTRDGRVNEQFNTNFMFDTQVPRWGLIFTTSVQCMWYVKTTRLRENGTPTAYLSAIDGQLHPFTAESTVDPLLRYLVRTYNDAAFDTLRIPTAIYVNLKATKQIGRWLRVSAFVNRIVDYLPSYSRNGLIVRRNSEAYFGMECTLTL